MTATEAMVQAAVYETAAEETATRASDLVVIDSQSSALAQALLLEVKHAAVELDAVRKKITAPLNQALDNANALFRPHLDALKAAERSLKAKIAGYEDRIRAEQEEARQKATELKLAGDRTEAAAVIHAVAPPPPQLSGVSTYQVWDWEVTDLAQVPDRYIERKIRAGLVDAELQTFGDKLAIPGIRFFQRTQVRSSKRGLRQ